MKRIIWLIVFVMMAMPAQAAIQSEEVQYGHGDVTLKGYLVYDDAYEGERPGVLVVHEWWGHNDYARKRADMLAELGYVALALDMYGNGKQADHPDTAGQFSGEVKSKMNSVGKERFEVAADVLKNHELSNDEKLAAIGYCFGGSVVLHMARYGVDLDGVVSFHGGLSTETPAQAGAVKARVLVFNGAADNFIPQEQIDAFKAEMDAAGADYQFVNLPEAKHSFTNPQADEFAEKFGMGIAYNEAADKESWSGTQKFLTEIFQ